MADWIFTLYMGCTETFRSPYFSFLEPTVFFLYWFILAVCQPSALPLVVTIRVMMMMIIFIIIGHTSTN